MSFSESTVANSFGDGRAAAGPASGAGPGAGAGAAVLGAAVAGGVARGAGAGATAGAGADVDAVVAGFFAQPLMIRPVSSSDDNVAYRARVSMTPPFASSRSTFGSQSYHGRRGDHEGLVASLLPCVTCVVVCPSTVMKNNCQRPVRLD